MAERFAGYREALERYNLKFKDEFVFHAETRNFPDVYEFAKKIISAKHIPHAIFASNDIFAIAFIKAAIEKGFKVPRDFSVVGFDDDKIANFSPVPLTTVRQSGEQLGRNVFNLLMQKIEDSSIKGERIILNPRLIVRQSTKKAGKFKD